MGEPLAEGAGADKPRWFGPNADGAFRPLTWQGRTAIALYLVLVAFALILYSDVMLIITVVVVYTAALAFVVAYTSDLLKDRLPPGG